MRALAPALAAVLLSLPATALASQVSITTEPTGGIVQLDGVSYGVAPVTIPKVGRGTHLLKISLEGYSTREDAIEVDGDSDLRINAPLNPAPKLVPQPPPPKPQPQPQLFPTTPAPQQPQPAPLPYANTQTVSPPPPAPQRIENREQLPIAWGTQKKSLVLVVETSPENAYVQVVGMNEVKRAPATFTGFAAGTVQLIVRAPGYQDKRVAVDLVQDARTRVTLEPAVR
jgi:hypothetical protein